VTEKLVLYTCPYCGHPYTSRVVAQMHYAACDQKPLLQRLSQDEFQALLNRAKEIDDARLAGRQ